MERKGKLEAFLGFLEEKFGFKFNRKDFDCRIRLQKYMYIAGFFGFQHNYSFSKYLHGPYSSNLADDYYAMPVSTSTDEAEYCIAYPTSNAQTTAENSRILGNFDSKGFKDIVADKSTPWLEIAATIFYVWNLLRNVHSGEELRKQVTERVSMIKSKSPHTLISEVFAELEAKGIISL